MKKPTYDDLVSQVKKLKKEVAACDPLKKELKESRERHESILENMVEGYYEVDLKGNFVSFNQAMQNMLGFEEQELIGMNNRDFMDNETARQVFQTFNKVYNTGEPSRAFNWTLITKDGGKRYIEASITLTRDGNGTPTGFQGIARDVTEIKVAENRLRQSEMKYRDLIDNTPDLLYQTNMEGVIVFISSSVYRLSGYTVQEALGMKMAEEVYAFPEERQRFLAELKQNGKIRDFEARLKRKGGSIWWASTNAHFFTDEHGTIQGVEGITRDITNQKKMEMALRESEEKFRLAFMTSPDAINLNRASDGLFIDINEGFTSLMGYTREEVLGKTSHELDIWVDVEDRKRLVEKLLKYGVVKDFEARFRRKDGEIGDGLMSARIIKIDDTDVILSLTRDITEHKRTQEVLIQSEKMLSVGGLAAGMAHEINNPIAGIVQNAQVIEKRLSKDLEANRTAASKQGVSMESIVRYMDERKIYDLLSSLRQAGLRAADIVSNILSFSRKSESTPSQFCLNDLIEQTIRIAENDYDLKKKYDFRKIIIHRVTEEKTIWITCNGSSIQQVLLNILRNSAEALFENEANSSPTITIRLSIEDAYATIEIEDNGPGIEADHLKRIFEPFFTTKPVGIGTGLGLSVSYFIVTEIHNGIMRATSAPGKGATFIVQLPVLPMIRSTV
ncbi:MAG: PAS domain-containing sensor histidine kinase [Desulfobacteraceae bacterium]|nr:MAG: PAS domain-containing sensor histidine kinase [Desulfobacteraceae bacterium]